jgi:hypothetical protein
VIDELRDEVLLDRLPQRVALDVAERARSNSASIRCHRVVAPAVVEVDPLARAGPHRRQSPFSYICFACCAT